MSLYTDLIEAGCEVSHWQSDLYTPRTPAALDIFTKHEQKHLTFISATDGKRMLEAPFMYDPFWSK